jgi:hypothetical protein
MHPFIRCNCSGLLLLFVVSVSMVNCFGVDIVPVGDRRFGSRLAGYKANADMSPSVWIDWMREDRSDV